MRESISKEIMLKSETNSTIEGAVSGMTNKLKEDFVFEYLETQNLVSYKLCWLMHSYRKDSVIWAKDQSINNRGTLLKNHNRIATLKLFHKEVDLNLVRRNLWSAPQQLVPYYRHLSVATVKNLGVKRDSN